MSDSADESVTQEAIEAAEASILQDVSDGIAQTTVDGLNVQGIHPIARLDALDRVRRQRGANNPFSRLRTAKLIPPGGGGR